MLGWVQGEAMYPVPVKGNLLGEALLRKVAHRIVVGIGEEVRQMVPLPCIHLQCSSGSTSGIA